MGERAVVRLAVVKCVMPDGRLLRRSDAGVVFVSPMSDRMPIISFFHEKVGSSGLASHKKFRPRQFLVP